MNQQNPNRDPQQQQQNNRNRINSRVAVVTTGIRTSRNPVSSNRAADRSRAAEPAVRTRQAGSAGQPKSLTYFSASQTRNSASAEFLYLYFSSSLNACADTLCAVACLLAADRIAPQVTCQFIIKFSDQHHRVSAESFAVASDSISAFFGAPTPFCGLQEIGSWFIAF